MNDRQEQITDQHKMTNLEEQFHSEAVVADRQVHTTAENEGEIRNGSFRDLLKMTKRSKIRRTSQFIPLSNYHDNDRE